MHLPQKWVVIKITQAWHKFWMLITQRTHMLLACAVHHLKCLVLKLVNDFLAICYASLTTKSSHFVWSITSRNLNQLKKFLICWNLHEKLYLPVEFEENMRWWVDLLGQLTWNDPCYSLILHLVVCSHVNNWLICVYMCVLINLVVIDVLDFVHYFKNIWSLCQ